VIIITINLRRFCPGNLLKEVFSWSIQEKSSPVSVVRSQGIGNGERGMVEKDSALGTRHLALETGNGERALSAGIIPARN